MSKKDIPHWLKKYLHADDFAEVETAIAEAEAVTSGEIVPVVIHHSTYLSFVPPVMVLLWTTIYLLILRPEQIHLMISDHPAIASVFALAGAVAFYWIGHWSRLQKLFISRVELRRQVLNRAELEFYRNGIEGTKAHTGILIFVSLKERQVVVLADKSIESKVNEGTWQSVVDLIVEGIRRESFAQGLCSGIRRAGEILREHFPQDSDDTDELPNRLIIRGY